MNKKQIYSLQNLEILTMVINKSFLIFYIIIIFIIIFSSNNLEARILYDKNNIIITDYDIENYKKYYYENYGIKINVNQSIKDIVLIKKLISNLEKKNNGIINLIDREIIKNIDSNNFIDEITMDLNRFIFIRNNLINEYLNKDLNLIDIENAFIDFKNMNIKLSINQCMTIDKVLKMNEINDFFNIYLDSLRKNNQILTAVINNKQYRICLDNNTKLNLEKSLYSLIETKTIYIINNLIYEKN